MRGCRDGAMHFGAHTGILRRLWGIGRKGGSGRLFKPFKAVFKRYKAGAGKSPCSGSTMPVKRWTEMESNWKEKASKYYNDGLKISDIALLLEVSR